jgi:hypothetical protein
MSCVGVVLEEDVLCVRMDGVTCSARTSPRGPHTAALSQPALRPGACIVEVRLAKRRRRMPLQRLGSPHDEAVPPQCPSSKMTWWQQPYALHTEVETSTPT